MTYERLTEYGSNGKAFYADLKHDTIRVGAAIDRLAELEDKIESGELISTKEQGDNEIAFFVAHNAAVRKGAVEECLRILRNIRLQLPRYYGIFWAGWSGAFNAAIRAISQKYGVSMEDGE